MRREDIIQELSCCGLRYARVLSHRVTPGDAEMLKKKFSYLHIYSYTREELPGFSMRAQKTPLFDLSESLEALFGRFNNTCKKHIRRGERNPDLALIAVDQNARESYALYTKAKQCEGVYPDLKREFDNCLLFNAYLKGRMIVTMSFYDNGEIIRAKHIASVRKDKDADQKIIAHASRRLNWEVIKWGKENGRKMFDLGGVTDDPTKVGIKEFKRSFGGVEREVYIYRYTTPVFKLLKRALNIIDKKNIN